MMDNENLLLLTLLYLVSENVYCESWQHMYTAVTRAKEGVVLVGNEYRVATVAGKRPFIRQTTLQERLECPMEE